MNLFKEAYQLFLSFAAPLTGLAFHLLLGKKLVQWIIVAAIVLLLPAVAGRAVYCYELSQTTAIPFWIKKDDSVYVNEDSAGGCIVYFEKAKWELNTCDSTLNRTRQ
jgi:hypothetical protein